MEFKTPRNLKKLPEKNKILKWALVLALSCIPTVLVGCDSICKFSNSPVEKVETENGFRLIKPLKPYSLDQKIIAKNPFNIKDPICDSPEHLTILEESLVFSQKIKDEINKRAKERTQKIQDYMTELNQEATQIEQQNPENFFQDPKYIKIKEQIGQINQFNLTKKIKEEQDYELFRVEKALNFFLMNVRRLIIQEFRSNLIKKLW